MRKTIPDYWPKEEPLIEVPGAELSKVDMYPQHRPIDRPNLGGQPFVRPSYITDAWEMHKDTRPVAEEPLPIPDDDIYGDKHSNYVRNQFNQRRDRIGRTGGQGNYETPIEKDMFVDDGGRTEGQYTIRYLVQDRNIDKMVLPQQKTKYHLIDGTLRGREEILGGVDFQDTEMTKEVVYQDDVNLESLGKHFNHNNIKDWQNQTTQNGFISKDYLQLLKKPEPIEPLDLVGTILQRCGLYQPKIRTEVSVKQGKDPMIFPAAFQESKAIPYDQRYAPPSLPKEMLTRKKETYLPPFFHAQTHSQTNNQIINYSTDNSLTTKVVCKNKDKNNIIELPLRNIPIQQSIQFRANVGENTKHLPVGEMLMSHVYQSKLTKNAGTDTNQTLTSTKKQNKQIITPFRESTNVQSDDYRPFTSQTEFITTKRDNKNGEIGLIFPSANKEQVDRGKYQPPENVMARESRRNDDLLLHNRKLIPQQLEDKNIIPSYQTTKEVMDIPEKIKNQEFNLRSLLPQVFPESKVSQAHYLTLTHEQETPEQVQEQENQRKSVFNRWSNLSNRASRDLTIAPERSNGFIDVQLSDRPILSALPNGF